MDTISIAASYGYQAAATTNALRVPSLDARLRALVRGSQVGQGTPLLRAWLAGYDRRREEEAAVVLAEIRAEGGGLDAAFCDRYVPHPEHTYRAVNRETYRCAGLTADEFRRFEAEAAAPPCEHGLSASLCADPINHYPKD